MLISSVSYVNYISDCKYMGFHGQRAGDKFEGYVP